MTYLAALVLTVAVELPLYVLGLVALRLAGPVRAVLLAVGVNLLTHPVLWFVVAPTQTATVYLAEVGVCLVEAAVIRLVVRRDTLLAIALSLAANAASFGVGLLVSVGVGG